jgi:ABC-2 type transport system ATP-binding protein
MQAIDARNVTKEYKGSHSHALNGISVNIQSGQIFTFLGRNGAGKTTFVRICATQLMPTTGSINVLGYDVVKQAKYIREFITIVPQEGRPLRALTPWDHVYNWLQIRGEYRNEARRRAQEMLEKLELWQNKDTPAMNLSGGMKQKVLVAMAMAVDAQLLFLDEPTIGLDPLSRRQVWSAIKEWKNQGKTVVLTTHYMDEAEILSDRIAIIDGGRIIANGGIEDLRKIIPHNTRVDFSKEGMDAQILKSYGSVVDTGAGSIRVFTTESSARELSELAFKKNLPFSISPVTLDDVFISLVKHGIDDETSVKAAKIAS